MSKETEQSHSEEIQEEETGEIKSLQLNFGEEKNSPAVMSLYRLESDIQKLHSKWADVEGELQERDATITRLGQELELRQANLQSLHDDLDKLENEREQMVADKDALKADMAGLEQQLRDKDAEMANRASEIENLEQQKGGIQADYEAAIGRISDLETSLKDQRTLTDEANEQIQIREKEASSLRTDIQELEAYIDRRKEEWERLNIELDDYRNSLLGLQKTMKGHDKAIEEREKEKSSLAKRIFELEQQVSELEGRGAERKIMYEELQFEFDKRGQEIDSLSTELASKTATADELAEKISSQEAHVDSLISEVSKKHERVSELELRVLEANNAVMAKDSEMAALSASENERIEARLADERAHSAEVRVERDELKSRNKELDDQLNHEREQAEELYNAHVSAQTELNEARGKLASLDAEMTSTKQRFEELQTKYDEHQKESVEVWAELKRDKDALDEARAQLAEREKQVAELEEDTKVFADEIGTMRDELIAKNQHIASLETELSVRKETITLLDKNVQRIKDMDNHIQGLGEEIADKSNRGRQPASASASAPVRDVVRMIVAHNGGQKIRFPLTKESMTIGRSMDNDIQLRAQCVSRNHARIFFTDDGVMIEDLGSKNGIFVNNKAVGSLELHNGDRVDIGEVKFEYVDLDEQDSAPLHA